MAHRSGKGAISTKEVPVTDSRFKLLGLGSAEFAAGAPSPEYRERMALAHDLTIQARDLDAPWAPQSSNPVKRRFEPLSRIIWQGRQWAATKYGVECRDGGYTIERKRLWEDDKSILGSCTWRARIGSSSKISPRRFASPASANFAESADDGRSVSSKISSSSESDMLERSRLSALRHPPADRPRGSPRDLTFLEGSPPPQRRA
jgi:hypothetical protein